MKADYLLRLDRKAEAEAAYTALLERNPDNSIYYIGLHLHDCEHISASVSNSLEVL
jgi:hypothetical protein